MTIINLKEDMHTHSTFSDGLDEPLENIRSAEARGLKRLAFTDHVRHTTTWLPHYVDALKELRDQTDLKLVCGVETKLMDGAGHLDMPRDMSGVEYVYVADHSFPLGTSFYKPREIRDLHDEGVLSRRDVVGALVLSTVNAMERYSGTHQLVLAHLFSILPKIRFNEATDIRTEDIEHLAYVAKKTGTFIEVSERWKCPNLRTLKIFADHGVPILCSSDAHQAKNIGVFDYNQKMASQFDSLGASNDTEVTMCAFPSFAAE